ncbi:hypothetical protein MRX96_020177 [Rhipicephalus microplus]
MPKSVTAPTTSVQYPPAEITSTQEKERDLWRPRACALTGNTRWQPRYVEEACEPTRCRCCSRPHNEHTLRNLPPRKDSRSLLAGHCITAARVGESERVRLCTRENGKRDCVMHAAASASGSYSTAPKPTWPRLICVARLTGRDH